MNRPFTADSIWTYPNGTLRNKFDIRNSNELDKKEMKIINKKLKNLKLSNFKKEDFLNLHKYLFEDLYDFAGELRDENIIMDNIMMCKATVVELCLHDLFNVMNDVKINTDDDLYNFLAYYYSELSIIAPFRDGNDITIKTFLEEFVKSLGYNFSFKDIDNNKLKEATIYSFYYDTTKLTDLLKELPIKNK